MLRSATGLSPSRAATLRRNVGFDVALAIGAGTTTAVVGVLLPTIARQGGLVPLGIALLSAAPFLGNLLSGFTGRYGPQRIGGFAALRLAGAALLLAVALAPQPAVILLAASLFWLSVSFGIPYQTRLWGALYPGDVRGRVIGVLGTARAAAAGVAALGIGLLADALGAPFAITLAGAVGAACAVAALGLRARVPVPARHYSPREAVRALTSRPELARLVVAQGFYGGGLIAAAPLYALVHVDRLHLTLTDVGTIAILSSFATTASYVAWGTLVDRSGSTTALRLGALLGVVALALYTVAPSVHVLWVAAILAGVSGAGVDLGIQGAIAAHTPLADRAAAMAGWATVTGARGALAPLVASGLVQSGVLSLTAALAVCLVPALIGLALYHKVRVPARVAGAAGAARAVASRPFSRAPRWSSGNERAG